MAASNSSYNNTEHFQFAIPTSGDYMIRVRWVEELFDTAGDANFDQYGLAWSTASVPEPTSVMLTMIAITFGSCTLRRRAA